MAQSYTSAHYKVAGLEKNYLTEDQKRLNLYNIIYELPPHRPNPSKKQDTKWVKSSANI